MYSRVINGLLLAIATCLCPVRSTRALAAQASSQPATQPSRIYVIQGGLSMMESMDVIQSQISRDIEQMPDGTSFDLIFVPNGKQQLFKPALVSATPDTRKGAEAFLASLQALGSSFGTPEAVRTAIMLRPDAVWFMSTGDFADDGQKLLRQLATVAKQDHVRIDTAFFGMTYNKKALRLMWDIAKESGGKCLMSDGTPAKEPEPEAKPKEKPRPAPDTRPSIFGEP